MLLGIEVGPSSGLGGAPIVGDLVHTDHGWVVVPPTGGAPITPVCESAHGKAWYNPADK